MYVAAGLVALTWIVYGISIVGIAKRAPVGAVVFGIFMGYILLLPTIFVIKFLLTGQF